MTEENEGFWYLGSPYSKYPRGIQAAYEDICAQQALLIKAGISVFCPISHTHGPAVHGNLDPLAHEIWIPADIPFMRAAKGIIVCKLDGWQTSYGLAVEIEQFRLHYKPIIYMAPGHVPELEHHRAPRLR
jgi:hypothetical protein